MNDPRLNIRLAQGFIQATRWEPPKEFSGWDLQLPNGDWVFCSTLDIARECASMYGCGILL